jgi:hypothetical protein
VITPLVFFVEIIAQPAPSVEGKCYFSAFLHTVYEAVYNFKKYGRNFAKLMAFSTETVYNRIDN